jgi:hypothetical protein
MIRETKEQVERQRADIERFASSHDWHTIHTPPLAKIDAVHMDDGLQVVAISEYKGRNYSSASMARLGTLLIDKVKMLPALEDASLRGVPLYLVVGLLDGLFEARVDDKPYTEAMGGRSDRALTDGEADYEPCFFYDWNLFTRVAEETC